MKPNSYKEAGVDIEAGDRFAQFISQIKSKALSKDIGGFAGAVPLNLKGIKDPLLLSSTDGVGTKLLVAQKLKKFDTVGIDLVAMCVNDLIVAGAKPNAFLDYIAMGALDDGLLQELITGIVKGCEDAQCILSGGETAEMPDLYKKGDFDLAGFATGIVDRSQLLPKKGSILAGDPIYGLASVGIHSNGLSLARKVLTDKDSKTWEQLLHPTKIYVKELSALLESNMINGAAHITGGGLIGNFKRVLPEDLTASFTWDWSVPEIFTTIQKEGSISLEEMRLTFNMGIGIAFTVSQGSESRLEQWAMEKSVNIFRAGTVING